MNMMLCWLFNHQRRNHAGNQSKLLFCGPIQSSGFHLRKAVFSVEDNFSRRSLMATMPSVNWTILVLVELQLCVFQSQSISRHTYKSQVHGKGNRYKVSTIMWMFLKINIQLSIQYSNLLIVCFTGERMKCCSWKCDATQETGHKTQNSGNTFYKVGNAV